MSARIRIGLADDEPLFAQGLAMILRSQPDFSVRWQAVHGQDALARARHEAVDVLLMDVQMPVMDGIEATRRFVDDGLGGRVVILTTFDADDFVLRGIDAGASGFLLKTTPPPGLIDAVRTVHSGDSVISPGPTSTLLRAVRAPGAPPLAAAASSRAHADPGGQEALRRACLTGKEVEVLRLIARGLTNQEICEAQWVSMATVKTHVGHLLAKTGARDRVQLVLFALRTGLMDADLVLSRAPSPRRGGTDPGRRAGAL